MLNSFNLNNLEQPTQDFLSGKISARELCNAVPRSSDENCQACPRPSLPKLRAIISYLISVKAYEQAGQLLDIAEENFTSIPPETKNNPRFGITRLRTDVLIAAEQPDAACDAAFHGIFMAKGSARLTPMLQWTTTLVRVGRREEALERLSHAFSEPLYRDDVELNLLAGQILLDLGNPQLAINHITTFQSRVKKKLGACYPILIQSNLCIGDRPGLNLARNLAENYFTQYPLEARAGIFYIMVAKHSGDPETFVTAIDRVLASMAAHRPDDSPAKLIELRGKAPEIISGCAKPQPEPEAVETNYDPMGVKELLRELFRPLTSSALVNVHKLIRPLDRIAAVGLVGRTHNLDAS